MITQSSYKCIHMHVLYSVTWKQFKIIIINNNIITHNIFWT